MKKLLTVLLAVLLVVGLAGCAKRKLNPEGAEGAKTGARTSHKVSLLGAAGAKTGAPKGSMTGDLRNKKRGN